MSKVKVCGATRKNLVKKNQNLTSSSSASLPGTFKSSVCSVTVVAKVLKLLFLQQI